MKHGNTETIETIEVLLHALLVATVKLVAVYGPTCVTGSHHCACPAEAGSSRPRNPQIGRTGQGTPGRPRWPTFTPAIPTRQGSKSPPSQEPRKCEDPWR